MQKRFRISVIGLVVIMFASVLIAKEVRQKPSFEEKNDERNGKVLSLNEFIRLASKNDTAFEEILIDELTLQYSRDIDLPAKDIVLAVKTQYDLYFDQDREEPETSLSLSKLFPMTATTVTAGYKNTPAYTSTTSSSQFAFTISQPIAQNAFGKATRLKDKIIGIEVEVAKHQVVEAYEDYFSAIVVVYYDWYEAYQNLMIGESSYETNLALLENIKERQNSKIAIELDVNKTTLQFLAKKEKLIDLRQKYQRALNFVESTIRYQGNESLIPAASNLYDDIIVDFESDHGMFQEKKQNLSNAEVFRRKKFS